MRYLLLAEAMNGRTRKRYWRPRVPAGVELRALRRPSAKQTAWACAAVLAVSVVIVFVSFSRVVGASLALSTTGLGIVFRQQLRDRVRVAESRAAAGQDQIDASHDPETRLANRVHLIEQLARDIARAQRYSQALTLAVVELSRFEDFRASWGAETSRAAVLHVAETLRRVARSSDFVARLDRARFAVVLSACDEAQAASFGDRLSLAVSNRPLRSTGGVRVPLYIGVDVAATLYRSGRFRGPLDFLSAAGGDLISAAESGAPPAQGGSRAPARGRALAADPQALRRQLVRDYYPDGHAAEFADAYREHRRRARRVT
jgi:diguanylate cyclase (GGDEF)-like protein